MSLYITLAAIALIGIVGIILIVRGLRAVGGIIADLICIAITAR
jgi:hypothetical protein